MSNFVKKLLNRAQNFPQQLVYTWVDDHGRDLQQVNISTVVSKASFIADLLLNEYHIKPGDRVLLVFPPCMDFSYVFLGCLFANIVPVPVYPPDPHKLENDLHNFSHIIKNCGAKIALTNSFYSWIKRFSTIKNVFNKHKKWPKLQWHVIKNPKEISHISPVDILNNELAFIQYTSGSTSTPKGVMISYNNIEHQLDFISQEALRHCHKIGPNTNGVSWLPPYHDFGLITGILGAPYGLYHLYKMSPLTFLRNPGIWFETVARTKAMYIAAPNFAYELAVRKTTHEQRKNWDLSHLKLIMSAAEPISLKTMERFFEAFAITGISPQSFCPAYGLAEHTIAVVSSGKQIVNINKGLVEQRQISVEKNSGNHTKKIVGCGSPREDVKIQIVDPSTKNIVNGIGEVWVSSPSKALGYYNNPEQTQEIFHAQLTNSQDTTRYLRTGDLGFIYKGELFITGRLKEVMILHGKNIYPQDIENTIRLCFLQIRPGGIATFSIEINEEEQLVVFAEVRNSNVVQFEELAQQINSEILAKHKISCHKIILAKPGFVLKTTSGKIRRRACNSYFQQQDFIADKKILYIYESRKNHVPQIVKKQKNTEPISREEIARFLQEDIGIDAFYRIVNSDKTQALENIISEIRAEIIDQRKEETDTNRLKKKTQQFLQRQFAMVLKLDSQEIEPKASLAKYGIDSILAIDLTNELEKTFGSLSKTLFFEYQSIEELTSYFIKDYKPKLQLLFDKTTSNKENETKNKIELFLEKTQQQKSDIKPKNREVNKNIPLAEGQKGLWVLQKISPGMTAYNIPLAVRVKKPDIEKLQKTCDCMMYKFPILQTKIVEIEGIPYQKIDPNRKLILVVEDVKNRSCSEIETLLRKRTKQPFDLSQDLLIRAYMFRVSIDESIVLFVIHHIIFDGASSVIFTKNFWNTYYQYMNESPVDISSPQVSYYEFIEWEQERLMNEKGSKALLYWQEKLKGELPVLSVPTDFPRTNTQSFEGAAHQVNITGNLTTQINTFARSHQVYPSSFFLSVWKVLLYRYTGQKDIIIGMPTLGRSQKHFENTVGYFINMLPIRTKINVSSSFTELLKCVQLNITEALDNSHPFTNLVRKIGLKYSQGIPPIFQVSYAYQNFFNWENANTFKDIAIIDNVLQEGDYELGLEIFNYGDHFRLHFKYSPELFAVETIERMANHFELLIKAICNQSNLNIDQFDFLSSEERNQILTEFNNTTIEYPEEKAIHQLFEEQVDKTPKNTALIFKNNEMTYRELNAKANQLAYLLREKGVVPDNIVAIITERSFEMIIGILGILKSGAAYLPVDPNYPQERINYMLEDAQVEILLTTKNLKDSCSLPLEIVELDNMDTFVPYGKNNPQHIQTYHHLAYVIYTSGSTGKPKGVMIDHIALSNHMLWIKNQFGFCEKDRVLQKTNFCFDAAVWEIFINIITGGTLVISDKNSMFLLDKITEEIDRYGVTFLQGVPSWLKQVANQKAFSKCASLKWVFSAGEVLSVELAKKIANKTQLCNMYGPTEACINATFFVYQGGKCQIGKPIDNVNIYIINKNYLCPIGIFGELCIGGKGLARGYLNHPKLTAEKFIENPYIAGEKIYKTGDMARWLADGNIEFLGRIDDQVKIRGFRIELGEIESILNQHENVNEAVVIVREDIPESKQLVAYIVSQQKQQLDILSIRSWLKKRLPEYMLPAHFIEINKLPLSPNGKMARNALPSPNTSSILKGEYISPCNETEKKLINIWQELLGIDQIGTQDNFFEIGGDSLLIMQLHTQIEQQLKVKTQITDLFKFPNIHSFAEYIGRDLSIQKNITKKNTYKERRKKKIFL